MTKRLCKGQRKAGGPCGANPMRPGTVIQGTVVSGNWCRQHDEDLPPSARIGGKQPGSGRPPRPRAVDVLRVRIEADIEKWLKPLEDALQAERTVWAGEGDDSKPMTVPDHALRMKAAAEGFDRAYGRPKQATEVSGPDGGPVQLAPIVIPDTDAYRRRVARIAAQALGVDVVDADG